ncbi:ATPase, T2SS/T4P/T4SS family [uncultured Desulfobacter sp.]|uniref:GspE/PulE family protein n=1 Tax=uncultured Desulfobacter sp. TaxID=240139 RepID=UPI0029F5871D|nr:ATPase, T2SS/T4P/T4SS family [uncultured Desulfobacter sp.]
MKLGELLVAKGKLTMERLYELLQLQKQTGKSLGHILVAEKILTPEELNQSLSEQLGVPHAWIRKGMVDPAIVHVLPKEKAVQFNVIPMFKVHNVLTVATSDPHNFFNQEKIQEITGLEIQMVLTRDSDIQNAIKECYQAEAEIDDVMTSLEEGSVDVVAAPVETSIAEISKMADGSPVINLTNLILLKSIRANASDIHIEPQQKEFRVRARVDGVLYELLTHRMERHSAVVSRLKIMANLDISERRLPQDGRIQVTVDGRRIDLRFSSIPGYFGEKLVIRILDKNQSILDINRLGFAPDILNRFKELVRKPYGLIIVCGPTGSGKTTTLYGATNMLNTPDKNIVAIEDPVEYQMEGVNQISVNAPIGLTFAKILKHVLRQDPDIILLGEIRDRETAEIAIQASLTGHLVLTTLHTNDSPSAITRLLEMGIEPYLISSSLLASMGQRLVRSICPSCKTDYYPPKEVLKILGFDESEKKKFQRGKGCTECLDSGYKGRIGIHELLVNDNDLQRLILANPTIDKIKENLAARNHQSLKHDGFNKVLQGLTTLEEIQRVTLTDDL